MLDNPIELVVFTLYFCLVPGSPLAFLFARRTQNWSLVVALSPLFSVGLNYFVLYLINFLGLKIDLKYLGFVMIAITTLTFVLIVQPRLREFRLILAAVMTLLPATIVGMFIWSRAYEGFLFLAPNHDGLNHNKWIARVIQTDSVLLSDSYIGSPLSKLGQGTGFYPMAWHSLVAIGSDISGLMVPTASLFSVFIVWTIVLPSSLKALANIWVPELFSLGIIAGILVQMYPLTPGMPLSWGSMTSVVGIGLLPAAFCLGFLAISDLIKLHLAGLILGGLSLFFIHTPEAASLFVLMMILTMSRANTFGRKLQLLLPSLGLIFLLPALFIFRDSIFNDYGSLKSTFGASEPFWNKAIGQFFTLDVNLPSTHTLLPILFIVGLIWAFQSENQRWLIAGVLSLGFVYLISGAPTSPLLHVRFLTAPWYASYERTLWLLVPFAALVSSYPIAKLLEMRKDHFFLTNLLLPICGILLLTQIVKEQIPLAITQMRSGPDVSALLGKDDLRVITESKKYINDGEVALSWPISGSTYPFMYQQVPVTAGGLVGHHGEISPDLGVIYSNINNLCNSEEAQRALITEKIAVVYFGTVAEWGKAIWTESEVRRLDGLKIVSSGEKLIATVPDIRSCP